MDFEDDKLSKNATAIIKNSEKGIFTSVITCWEISLKYSLGKLELENITPEELPFRAREINIETLDRSVLEASTFYPRLSLNASYGYVDAETNREASGVNSFFPQNIESQNRDALSG